jgi:hypothetical protein
MTSIIRVDSAYKRCSSSPTVDYEAPSLLRVDLPRLGQSGKQSDPLPQTQTSADHRCGLAHRILQLAAL